MNVRFALVSDSTLDVGACEQAVRTAASGAVVTFSGVVRNHDDGRSVTLLEYVGHPSAERVLAEVAGQAAADSEVHAVAVAHRIGTLAVGDTALVAVVSAAHRQAAFAACARLVEEVKARLPVWKRQVFLDGTDEWVGSA